jgi:hypothetical protein
MKRKMFLPTLAISLALSSTAAFSTDKPEINLSAQDTKSIDTLVAPIFTNLKAGDYEGSVKQFLGLSPMFTGKKQEMQFLVNQIQGAADIYGPITECPLDSVETKAGIAQSRQYLCQHENFVTRWIVVVAKTSKGWGPISLSFDDQIMRDM